MIRHCFRHQITYARYDNLNIFIDLPNVSVDASSLDFLGFYNHFANANEATEVKWCCSGKQNEIWSAEGAVKLNLFD